MKRAGDFKVGERVRMTKEALQQRLQGRAKTRFGTVRRVPSQLGFRIYVQREGLKSADSYHCKFWDHVRGGGPGGSVG